MLVEVIDNLKGLVMKAQDQMSASEFYEIFPNNESVLKWFEKIRQPEGYYCSHCGSKETYEVKYDKYLKSAFVIDIF